MEVIKNSLGQSHDIIRSIVKKGDSAIDATAGNGNDTAFLAELVGEAGMVYSFDIQSEALQKTAALLDKRGLSERATLIRDGHQNMDRYVSGDVKAVMFNLGYLPGGDHSIGTRAETTIQAVENGMGLIAVGGIISVVVYYGGDSGFDEKEAFMRYIQEIDYRRFKVMKTEFVNQPNCPPILVCIERLK
ncbi:putative rRNA methylase [Anaerobacterium chartisolvens]|uniref:Putative rRNA methylase n=1 Tax=Anaerobacterium chartisolvens TaxID=1297424 RepID=A0A369BH99_9FIRM|nr:class I SAM-dependent methyltransferase [Anaerobacterium chartisolvens]RCX19958.1 putative rRNA methylase [Anaerobacterium chartisolvens]